MNQHGLYSKAAQIIRNLQQERGTADQMVAAAKVKSTELKNAGPLPEGKVTREQLAQHFENAVPKMYVSQYGENPSFMPKGSGKRFMDLQMRNFDDKLSPDEKRELNHMSQRNSASPFIMGQDEDDGEGELHDPQYDNYQTPGGQNYRERLLTLGKRKDQDSYHSSHWTEHENVLAHIRMKDRLVGQERSNIQPIMKKLADGLGVGIRDLASGAASVGIQHKVITPEEAATLSRFMGWRNGYDQAPGIEKKLLHVEELQSDWGQDGREKGFYDPKKPYEVFNKKTGEVLSSHPTHSDAWDAFRSIPEDQAADLDYGRSQKVPGGPYVGNTQHWTDLALKNVLREAALGNYDGVVFTPGQAQADRYGLEKQVDAIHYTPETKTLHAQPKNGGNPIVQSDVEPQHLPGLIGKEAASKLMDPSNAYNVNGTTRHSLVGDDLKMGGEGMKGYYDSIVPKSVMALAKQHDPDAQPGEPVQMGQYQGFHLPMTDKMKSSILDSGFSAFKRGGRVGNLKSWFGNSVTHTNGEPHVFYTGTSKDKDFTAFNVGRHGAWFTRDPAVASQYAEQNDSQGYKRDGWNMVKTNTASRVIPAYVKAENPYTGEYAGEMHSNYKKAQSDWFDTLRAKGHDAWMPASQNGNLVVALKEPQQIKSLYNSGDFDPNQKHMGKAGGGEVDSVNDNQIGGIENAQTAAGDRQAGTQALGLLGSGGIRGGQGILSAPPQASGEEDLIGLPKSVKMPKLGQTVTAAHDPRIRQVSRDYAQAAGLNYNPPTTYQKVDPSRAKRIAAAYEAMPHDPSHPLVRASYAALLNETKAQYDAMKRAGVKLEFYPDVNNDPYKSNPRLAVEDIRHNNHMYVYPTDAGYGTGDALPGTAENPMLGDSGERWNGKPVMFNDLFRAVHDYFGHAKEGVGFRADGEENAWRQHAAMFSPLARIALTTETRGQNSWLNYGPHGDKNRTAATEDTVFAPQKLGFLPIWAHHEGADDFMSPQERQQMEAIYRKYDGSVGKALNLTRRFTKDGKAATMALKSKGN